MDIREHLINWLDFNESGVKYRLVYYSADKQLDKSPHKYDQNIVSFESYDMMWDKTVQLAECGNDDELLQLIQSNSDDIFKLYSEDQQDELIDKFLITRDNMLKFECGANTIRERYGNWLFIAIHVDLF